MSSILKGMDQAAPGIAYNGVKAEPAAGRRWHRLVAPIYFGGPKKSRVVAPETYRRRAAGRPAAKRADGRRAGRRQGALREAPRGLRNARSPCCPTHGRPERPHRGCRAGNPDHDAQRAADLRSVPLVFRMVECDRAASRHRCASAQRTARTTRGSCPDARWRFQPGWRAGSILPVSMNWRCRTILPSSTSQI